MIARHDEILIRPPRASDGYAIHQLIANSPPLDLNSVYSYYLLCRHFGDCCVVAEDDDAVVGFISAYRLPQRPDTLFVWQVVVDGAMRGRGLARGMLTALLQRFGRGELSYLEATVNPSNSASRALFQRLANERGSPMQEESFLDAAAFGPHGAHESEVLLRIPLNPQN